MGLAWLDDPGFRVADWSGTSNMSSPAPVTGRSWSVHDLRHAQVRAPSYEAVLSSGWPLFGMRPGRIAHRSLDRNVRLVEFGATCTCGHVLGRNEAKQGYGRLFLLFKYDYLSSLGDSFSFRLLKYSRFPTLR